MMNSLAWTIVAMIGLSVTVSPPNEANPKPPSADRSAIEHVLDELHDAASKADGARYFRLFAPDAVFLGTDATERWPIEEFKAYAMKRFESGTGWTYKLIKDQRHVSIGDDGSFAWFDELLENAKYGTCRGTGVLRKVNGEWRIAQYSLSIPIPNELALDVVKMVRQRAKG